MTALILRTLNTQAGVWDALTYRAYLSSVTRYEIAGVRLADAVDTNFALIRTAERETAGRLTETIKTLMGSRAAYFRA